MPTSLQTILFDLGNVLVHFSHERMCRQVGELCGLSESEMRALLLEGPLHHDYERGRINCSELVTALSAQTGRTLELEAVREAAGNIFEQNDEMVDLASDLKSQGLRLVLLSNTCPAHIDWIRDNLQVLDLFDYEVLSYEVGAAKPEAAIFDEALRHIDCAPVECLYVDDVAAYVNVGRGVGLRGAVFSGVEQFIDDLACLGVEFPQRDNELSAGTLESSGAE